MINLTTLSLLSLLSLLFTFYFYPTQTSAHVLESNNTVGAVMHITPNDNPVAGEESGFFFEFKDKENKFRPDNCTCTFSILQSGKEIYSQSLFQNTTDPSLTNVSILYTFPKKGTYLVKVTGEPTAVGIFEPFTLSYDIMVEKEATIPTQVTTEKKESLLDWTSRHIFNIVGTIIMLGLVGYSFYVNQLKGVKTTALSDNNKKK